MREIAVDYAQLISIITAKSLLLQYSETSTHYELYAPEAQLLWTTCLLKGSEEGTDFETKHKSKANRPLEYRNVEGVPRLIAARTTDLVTMLMDGTDGYVEIAGGATAYIRYEVMSGIELSGVDLFWRGVERLRLQFEVGIYLGATENDFFPISTFGKNYQIVQTEGQRNLDSQTVAHIPAAIQIGETMFGVVIRATIENLGNATAHVSMNLQLWK